MISFKFKLIGMGLLVVGFILTAVYFTNRLDLSVPVFAINSSYLETRYFTIISNNISEELIVLFLLAGFLMTSFSKEKTEYNEFRKLRGEAWQKAVLLNTMILVFFTIFIYGAGFMAMLVVNMFSCFVLFHFIFIYKKRKLLRIKTTSINL